MGQSCIVDSRCHEACDAMLPRGRHTSSPELELDWRHPLALETSDTRCHRYYHPLESTGNRQNIRMCV